MSLLCGERARRRPRRIVLCAPCAGAVREKGKRAGRSGEIYRQKELENRCGNLSRCEITQSHHSLRKSYRRHGESTATPQYPLLTGHEATARPRWRQPGPCRLRRPSPPRPPLSGTAATAARPAPPRRPRCRLCLADWIESMRPINVRRTVDLIDVHKEPRGNASAGECTPLEKDGPLRGLVQQPSALLSNKNAPAVACAGSNDSHKNRLHVQLDAARRVQHWCQCGTLNVRKPYSKAAAAGARPPLSKRHSLSPNASRNATAARPPNILARPRRMMLQGTLRTDRGKIGWERASQPRASADRPFSALS